MDLGKIFELWPTRIQKYLSCLLHPLDDSIFSLFPFRHFFFQPLLLCQPRMGASPIHSRNTVAVDILCQPFWCYATDQWWWSMIRPHSLLLLCLHLFPRLSVHWHPNCKSRPCFMSLSFRCPPGEDAKCTIESTNWLPFLLLLSYTPGTPWHDGHMLILSSPPFPLYISMTRYTRKISIEIETIPPAGLNNRK